MPRIFPECFSGGGGRRLVTTGMRTSSARKTTVTTSSAATERPKSALVLTARLADRKCNTAVVSSSRTSDVDDIKTSRYMYEPHVVVQRRDDNNRIYTVLVPVGKAVPIVEVASSRQPPAVAATASVPDMDRPNHRRRKMGSVIPPSLDATGHVTFSSVESNAHFSAALSRQQADNGIRLPDSVTVSGDLRKVEPSLAHRPSAVSRSVSVDKLRTVHSATVMAVVPDGGGVGLDIELTRLIASVDSLHVPSSRRSKCALTSRLKSKRTMQTIMADLNRFF